MGPWPHTLEIKMKLEQIPHHLFFHNNNLVTDYGLQYRLGEHSVACNDAMHVLLSLLDIDQGHPPIIDLELLQELEKRIQKISPVNAQPDYQEPNKDFILALTNLATRIKVGIVGSDFKGPTKQSKTGLPVKTKLLKINFTRLAIVHFNKYGYWASISQLKAALKAHATEIDKMAESINSKLSEEVNVAKDRTKLSEDLYSTQPVLLNKPRKAIEKLEITSEGKNFLADAFEI